MDDTLHILIADCVPVANKGEEAIVRGIEDTLAEGRPVALGLFDDVPEPTRRDNITVFPKDWIFRFQGLSGLSGSSRALRQILIALQLRCGLYGRLKNLVSGGAKGCQPLRDFFRKAKYVLVGHDGVFGVESCGIIHLAKAHGKRTGIYGASTGVGGGRFYKRRLYRRALDESDFCVFREEHSCASMRRVCSDPEKLVVGPDPAFAMRPVDPDEARAVLEQDERYRRAREAGRPIVAVTALETGRVYAGFRPDLRGKEKQEAHARYLAAILDGLLRTHRAFILFLPHSVEQSGSDIVAAQHVVERMTVDPDDVMILERDCQARLLKGIIGLCDFLIGERTHSLIGSVAMGTPFVALTNRRDTRTHGIIGQMCRCSEHIVDMDVTGEEDISPRVLERFSQRDVTREFLRHVRRDLSRRTEAVSRLIKWTHGGHPEP
jgi:polysaccharide pyruvyl transferase WcaK-like protein